MTCSSVVSSANLKTTQWRIGMCREPMTTAPPAAEGVGVAATSPRGPASRRRLTLGRHLVASRAVGPPGGRRPRPSCLGCGRGRAEVPRVGAHAQPASLDPRGHARDHDAGQLPLRRLRARCRHRRHGGHDRSRAGLGDRAVPLLRPAAVGARPRRDHRRPRQGHHPGPLRRARRRHGDPHGQRGPRPPRPAGVGGVGRDAERAGARGLRPAAHAHARRRVDLQPHRPAHGRRHAAGTRCRATRGRTAGRRCGRGCPTCSSRRRPRWRSSATTSRSASVRRSARYAGGNSLDNTLRVCRIVPTEWVLHRRPGRRRAAGLRPRHRPPVGPGRHPARHRQPVDDRALLEPRRPGHEARVREAREHHAGDDPMTYTGYGMTIPFDGVPLHEQRDWIVELEDLGYTDVWSSEANGADGFTPLTLASVWAPSLRLGSAIVPVVHPRAGHARPVRRLAGRRRAGTGRVRHRHVVQRDRRAVERHPVHRAVQEDPRHGPLPARRAQRREGEAGLRHVRGQRASSSASSRSSSRRSSWPHCARACCAWPVERATAPSSTGSGRTT